MCLTPGKGTPASAPTDGGTAAPVANGPGQTQGNSIGAPPADGAAPISSESHNGVNINGTAASSTTQISSTSKTSDSTTNSSLSTKVAASSITTAGGAKASPSTPGAGTPTLKLKGSLTSSIASKFGGNTAVFPKLGVGGLTSPKIGASVNGSLAAKKFELGANSSSTTSSSSTKVEFAAIKLKKVSKVTTSSSSSSSSSSSTSSSTTVEDKAKTVDEKRSNDTVFLSTKVASETAASKKSSSALSSKSSSEDRAIDSIKSVKETVETESKCSKSPSDISAKSSKILSLQSEKTQSTDTLNKTVSSAKSISQSSSKGSTESLSSSSVKSVSESASSAAASVLSSSNSTSSSSAGSYHSSSRSTKTVITSSIISSSNTSVSSSSFVSTSSINSNALCRSTTIKNSDIPAIASKTLIALSNAGEEHSGDTDIKVTTSVKKLKKSSDLSVKKKKKKVSGRDSEGKEIPIIEEGTTTTESPVAPGTTDLSMQADQDRAVNIKVVSSAATTKENDTKNLSKSTLVNGVPEEISATGVSEASVLKRDQKSVSESATKTVTITVRSDGKNYGKADRSAPGSDEIIVLKKGKKGDKGSPLVSKKVTMAVPSPTADSASAIATSDTTSSDTTPVLPSPKSPSTSIADNMAGRGLRSSPSEIANDLQSSLASLSLDSGVSSSASAEAGTSSLDEVVKSTDPVQQGGSGTACDLSIPEVASATAAISIPNCAAVPSSLSSSPSATAAISIPNCAAVPSSLSSSPSVCSLSTATDTLSTSISTSTSDLSISPPAFMPTCTSGGGVTAASIMSTSTTTLSSTSTNLPSTCVTTSTAAHPVALPNAVDGGSSVVDCSSATGGDRGTSGGCSTSGWFLPSTLFTSDEPVTVIVRDMSSITLSINRTSIYAQGSSTVRSLLVEVGHRFGYEPDSFSLTMQNTRTTDMVELERLDPYTTLEAAGFIVDGVSRNGLLLTDLHGTAPKKTGAEPASGSRDDDLALGASASPTSCGGGEDSGMHSSSSTTGASSRHKKHVWPDLDVSTSSGAAASTSSSHEYTKYTYGCGTSKQDTGYVGLVNQAMTCYLNSLLQTLYMTPEFRNALYRWEFKGSKEEGYKSIPFQLQKLFLLLQTTDRSAVETTRLTRSFGWDSSEAWQQHDIQELCRVMFEALEQSFANTDQANLIDTLYQGKMKDYVKCLACGNENARMDSFLDIPLPIRPFGSSTAYQSLEEALRAFVTPELLSGTNQYRCSNCDSMCDAHKGLAFTRYPYLLTIHLKRFDFDYQTFHRIKLNDRVTFPNQLDLSEFLDVPTKDEEDAMSPSTDAVVASSSSSSTTPGGGGGVCSSNKSDSAASSGGPLDDAATDDSGSALDNEDSSLVDFTPPHNTTQEEDEGIDLTTASDTERSSTDKVKVSKKSGATKKERAATTVSSLSGASSKNSPSDGSSVEVSSKDNINRCSSISNVSGTSKNEEKDAVSSKDSSTTEVNPDDIRQDERYTSYQLFSIMIHSGSASGGHYYAYVKDFVTEDWFCFNDQSVTRISDDDIKRTYGSGTRGITGFAASANAYMLMYRQINDNMNVLPFDKDNFPVHVKKLCSSLVEEEEQEREARERERCTCVIKLFCHHPATAHLSDMKLRVHKDATLAEATRQAHQELELYKSVPIERCRLVKYEEYQDSLESSFEDQDDKPMSEVLGGVKSSYKFDLLMEVREESQKFEVYRPGGLSVKVYVVSLTGCGEVEGPHIIRGTLTMTVAELKQAIGRSLNLNSDAMRIVAEGFYNEMKLLADDALQLRTEGLYRSSKVFVEASGEESIKFFTGSQMSSVIDRYQNTITLYCNLPQVSPAILSELKIPPYCEEAVLLPQPQAALTAGTAAASIEESSSNTSEDGGVAPTTDVTAALAAGAVGCEGSGEVAALAADTAAVTAVTAVDTATPTVTPVESPVVSNVTNTSTNADGSSPLPPSQPPTTPTTNTSKGDTAACSNISNSNNNSCVPGASGTSSAITNVNTNNSLSNITSSYSSNNNISLSSQKQNLTLPVPSTSVLHSPSSLSSSTNSSSASAAASSCSEAHLSSDASGHCNLVIVGTSIPAPSPGGQSTPGDGGGGGSGGGTNLSDGEDDDGACGGGYSTLSSDQSTSEDSSLTSDSDRTLVGDPPEDDRLSDRCNSPDYHNVSSPEEPSAKVGLSSWSAGIGCDDDDVRASVTTGLTGAVAAGTARWAASTEDPPWSGDGDLQPVKRYFKAKALAGSDNPDERVLEMRVDNRMTVDQLKAAIQPHVGVPLEHFKLYKKYTQEFECNRGGEMVKNFGECGRLVAKLDRALQEGEYRGKVYLLDMSNTAEPAKFLIDFVLREGDTVAGVKAAIVKEVNSSCGLALTVDGVRLRRKSWKNPQTVYLDHQVFGERDITLHNSWELFIQERALPELKTSCSDDQLVLFARRWRPSQYSLDAVVELLVPDNSGQTLRQKLSEVSGITADNVQVAKGRNTFPHEVSVLEISTELEWTKGEGPLDARPLNIIDDGALLYYRDKEERLKELTESERSDLEGEENRRLNRELPYATTLPAARPAKEKGLKIYFSTE